MDRAAAISTSVRGFVYGLIGLIPFVGLLPAVCAIEAWVRVRTHFHPEWNPAGIYLAVGAILGLLGILVSILVVVGIVASVYLS